jgi:uncharacterized repeat protein (TIGR01451 family)
MRFQAMYCALRPINLLAAALILTPQLGHAATINSPSANTDTVGRYLRYEVTFNLTNVSPSNYNPFRPETTGDSLSPAGVDVWAEVVTPSGAVKKVWGYYDVDYGYYGNSSKSGQQGADRMIPVSASHWHVRYAPMDVGPHKITVKVKDQSGTTSSQQLSFNCVESGNKGFIRVSDDGTRLVYSDGSPYVCIGTMAPYGTEKVAPTTAAMKANGMNFIRKWLVDRDKDDIFRNLEGWYSYSADTGTVRTGKQSAVRNVTGAGSIVDQSFVGCKPNTYYKAHVYLKTSSSFNGEAAVYVNEQGKNVGDVTRVGNSVTGGKDWTLSQIIFKTGSSAEMLHFKPRVLSGSSGTVWVDDAGLYECDSSGNPLVNFNILFNPSFEPWNPSQLRLVPLARLEYLLQKAEENGIAVQPCMFNYRLWNKSAPTGFYAAFFGDWWTDSASIAQQERALRYLVARFGSYRSLFAWELTNEMDSSYATVRGNWIAGRSNFIKSGDPQQHPVTNSYWGSPADYEYAQMKEIDVGQVHNYLNTEERTTGQGYPSWWTLSSGMSIETGSGNVASGGRALKAVANGGSISDAMAIYCKQSKSYTVRGKIKTSGVSGKASIFVRCDGGSSPGPNFTLSATGTSGYASQSRSFTTGSTAVSFTVNLTLDGSSGTAWWDDIEVIDDATGRLMLPNGGFESPPLGDDEFDWAVYYTTITRQRYDAGPSGVKKPWVSGENGLMGPTYNLSYWARYGDTTKPRHDTTGIHVHNAVWAQLMASAALNAPTYWWVDEYIVAYNLWSVWLGPASFVQNLPFYGRKTDVSTDPLAADARASSSDQRIRLLGQKTSNSGYFWIQNKENTWSRVVREGLKPTPTSATLTIPGFENGAYTAVWYDAYSGKPAQTALVNVSGGALTLSVSSLSTDVAVIVRKTQATTQPEVSIVLTADKSTAFSGDVVTYTLAYTNKGSGDAVNVNITLPIPANTTYVPGSGGTYDAASNSVRWVVPALAPGASGQCTVKVRIN